QGEMRPPERDRVRGAADRVPADPGTVERVREHDATTRGRVPPDVLARTKECREVIGPGRERRQEPVPEPPRSNDAAGHEHVAAQSWPMRGGIIRAILDSSAELPAVVPTHPELLDELDQPLVVRASIPGLEDALALVQRPEMPGEVHLELRVARPG